MMKVGWLERKDRGSCWAGGRSCWLCSSALGDFESNDHFCTIVFYKCFVFCQLSDVESIYEIDY